MKIIDRKGNEYNETDRLSDMLKRANENAAGRLLLKAAASPLVSKASACALSSRFSASFAQSYADKYGIDMFDFEKSSYDSFNDFFTRKIKPGRRFIQPGEDILVSPCDGKATAYEISKTDIFVIKNSVYSVASLLRDKKLSERFAGGYAVILRLTPDDYHRYIYPAGGFKSHNRRISGALNSVRPITNEFVPVYKENSREYCMLRTKCFGDIIQMEIGAALVGKINNYERGCAAVIKGAEKGRFEFGGSTVILLLQSEYAEVCGDLLENTRLGYETKVKLGEIIANAKNKNGAGEE